MLTALEDEILHWECRVYDDYGDLTSCGTMKRAPISSVQYVQPDSERGAMIALPRCECGSQMFLKADYTYKDVWACSMEVRNDTGHVWAQVMRLEHARNLLVHWMLYEREIAPTPPVIDLPPRGAQIEGVPQEVFAALWFAQQAKATVRPLVGHKPLPEGEGLAVTGTSHALPSTTPV